MSTLRNIYHIISAETDFNSVVELIEKHQIDINEQDTKGRTLLFYMIDVSSCNVDVTLDFIKKYQPKVEIYDKYGQTIFYRFKNTVNCNDEGYDSDDVHHLIDILLNQTPDLVLLKRDNQGHSCIKKMKRETDNFGEKNHFLYPYTFINRKQWFHQEIMNLRLKCIYWQIKQHINRKCTLFNMMYAKYEIWIVGGGY